MLNHLASPMSDDFFTEQKEQSLVKPTMIEKYFVAWAKIVTHVVRDLPPDKHKIANLMNIHTYSNLGCSTFH